MAIEASLKMKAIARDIRCDDLIVHAANIAFLCLLVTCTVKLLPFSEKSNPKIWKPVYIGKRRPGELQGISGRCSIPPSKLDRLCPGQTYSQSQICDYRVKLG